MLRPMMVAPMPRLPATTKSLSGPSLSAGSALHLVEGAGGKTPLVQAVPAHPDGILQALVRPGRIAVHRHCDVVHAYSWHRCSFIQLSRWLGRLPLRRSRRARFSTPPGVRMTIKLAKMSRIHDVESHDVENASATPTRISEPIRGARPVRIDPMKYMLLIYNNPGFMSELVRAGAHRPVR